MKYTGRIVLLALWAGAALVWAIGEYVLPGIQAIYLLLFGIVLYAPLCWWLGRRYDEAKFYSEKDPLTEAHNRRYVHKTFPKLRAMADRNGKQLGLLVLDINDFKSINDAYGHKRGDLVLQRISAMLSRIVRRSDVTSRWGGDEFMVIVPFMDKPGIEALTKRIEDGLKELTASMQTEIHVSIGSALYPTDAVELDELMEIADRDMYQVKSQKETETARKPDTGE